MDVVIHRRSIPKEVTLPKIPEIKKVAAHALSNIDAVLSQWLPNGKYQGHEYLPLNPKRADSQPGSFSINTKTGSWSDFATNDRGGDLVGLIAYLESCSQGKAAGKLAALLNIPLDEKSNTPRTTTKTSRGGVVDDWQCVLPVPYEAPEPPLAHSRHGKPTHRYAYTTTNGQVNFYHDRYEKKEGERKQFAPLTLWSKDDRFEWRFKAPPEPRYLYGLPGLVAFPNASVWFVEGEKPAHALIKLLPHHPVLTWQGGSQAVAKSDYYPLKGRECVIFPDNDQAGAKAAINLAKELQAVKAASVRVLDVSKLEREPGQPLQPSDDSDDLLKAGWNVGRFAEFIKRDDILIDTAIFTSKTEQDSNKTTAIKQPDDVETIERFQLFERGLYVSEQQKDGSSRIRWICSPIKPLALVRTEKGREWGLLVWLIDPDGKEKKIVLGMRMFNAEGQAASGELLDAGIRIGTGNSRKLVIEYLQTSTPEKRARTTNRTGWHGSIDEPIFVQHDGCIGSTEEEWLLSDNRPDASLFEQHGTLEEWRDHVASLCIGNSRPAFAVSVAFAAPLLHLAGLESGGFHFRDSSTVGKTTSLYVAGSVCGSPNYLERWRTTDNGLESVALAHCDALLTLDEIKMISPHIVGEAAYMLANGAGKARANHNGGARSRAKWRLLFLSSGELSLSQHAAEAGKKTPAGAEVRMADIPADAGKGYGCFEELHGFSDGKQLADAFGVAYRKYYGTAFPAFIEYILQNREIVLESLPSALSKFEEATLTSAACGQVRRVAARFALGGAAGELATKAQITGWTPGEAMGAAITCFKAWLQTFGGEGSKEERSMIEQVRYFIESHGESRFTDIDRSVTKDDHAPRTMNKAGFREKNHEGQLEYYCYPEVFKTEICKGYDYKAVSRVMIDRGFMKPDGRNFQVKKEIPGEGRKRIFHILPAIWSGEND